MCPITFEQLRIICDSSELTSLLHYRFSDGKEMLLRPIGYTGGMLYKANGDDCYEASTRVRCEVLGGRMTVGVIISVITFSFWLDGRISLPNPGSTLTLIDHRDIVLWIGHLNDTGIRLLGGN